MDETCTQISISKGLKDMAQRVVGVYGRPLDVIRAFETIIKVIEKITAMLASKDVESKAKEMAIGQSHVIVD